MSDLVLCTIEPNGVARVSLNRPDRMNALTAELFDDLIRVALELKANPALRVVVLHGEGRAFSAGLDLDNFKQVDDPASRIAPGKLGERTHGDCNFFQYAALVWNDLHVPVIAAIHGVAFGGGLQLALGADMRLIAPDAKMSVMEVRWGLVPDMGGMWVLKNLLRTDQIADLVFSGRVVTAPEAVHLGLATRIAEDPLDDAMNMANSLANLSPNALREAKNLINFTARNDRSAILQRESDVQDELIGGPDQREAVNAYLEKRAPQF
ncbi:MAG: crotonase/enoyl-CoA hydratase family protein [Limnobacter sp.]|uniref:crotonase/enoyl-CoA hydratase family protein n=1 Tax=Limnobacter sp. TaxID=2003368 RepID=UPI0022C411FB|nr:crotonase/enoyl-CoA hydratase family protein [Limnobacter sp.]MCZ8014513.1 crotonase/enoyl-CoA hydratase family protein [Limnobacter sp.]